MQEHEPARRPRLLARLLALTFALLTAACAGGDDEPEAAFEITGATATMSGLIGASTPDAVRSLLEDHPEVTTIALVDVPGSGDDQANLEASRLIRSAGLATHVPSNGEIASGGVDFFLAGATRSFDEGARFGVHSWADGDGVEGKDIERDKPDHDLYLDYYEEMGIEEAFYWFTLDAAPADRIHWMTPTELETHGFATAG